MKNFINKNRLILSGTLVIVYCILAMYILPVQETLTPEITGLDQTLYSGEGIENVSYDLSLSGTNLERVDTVYINGTKSEDSQIIYSDPYRITITLPADVYSNGNSFTIQVSRTAGGIYNFKSRKYVVPFREKLLGLPEIIEASVSQIYRGKGIQWIILKTENMSEESKLYIDGEETHAVFDYNNCSVAVSVEPDMYSEKDHIELQLATMLNETQKLQGNILQIPLTEFDYKEYRHSYPFVKENEFIMHAGGKWLNHTYTNCLEAFLSNYEKGCRIFELDLIMTSDDVIVGRHDWSTVLYDNENIVSEDELLLESEKRNNLPKTYKELDNMYKDRTPLTWNTLLDYLSADNTLYIVTDTKYYTEKAVEYFFGKLVETSIQEGKENVLNQVIVQIYNQDMYRKLMETYPFQSVIYTLYMSPDSDEDVLRFIDNSNVRAVTLAQGSVHDNNIFFQELLKRNCAIYVHTINDISIAAQYMMRGCSGIYTDTLTSDDLQEINHEINMLKEVAVNNENAAIEAANLMSNTDTATNKKYLLNYLQEINNKQYLIFMCVQGEATAGVDDEIAKALTSIGVSPEYRYADHMSYLGIVCGGDKIYEDFSENLLEYTYIDGENSFYMKSTGEETADSACIVVNGYEQTASGGPGLHMVVFNKTLGIVQDRIVFNLHEGLSHVNYLYFE